MPVLESRLRPAQGPFLVLVPCIVSIQVCCLTNFGDQLTLRTGVLALRNDGNATCGANNPPIARPKN